MDTVRPIPFQLDLNTKVRANPKISATVGDKNSLTLEVTLTVNSMPFDLTGWDIYFKALLPDGEHYVLDGNHEKTNAQQGTFKYTFVQEAFSVAGTVKNAKFMLTQGNAPDKITHSFEFSYQVLDDPIAGHIEAANFVSDYTQFKEEIQAMMQDSLDNSAKALTDSQAASNLAATAEADMQALRDEIASSGNVKTGDTANWQKYKLTKDDGVAKSVSNMTTLSSFVDAGVYYVSATVANNLTDIPINQGFRLENIRLTSGSVAEQTIRYFNANGEACREFRRYGTGTWAELATVKGTQDKIDALANVYEPIENVTAWTAPALNSSFSIVSSSYPLLYRKKGTVLQVKGAVNRTNGAKGVLFNLPEGFRPKERRARACGHVSSVNGAVATIYIQANGDVELTNAFNDTGVWIEFDLELG